MDEKIEAFREEVLRWRGTRRKGARPYTAEMKAKALRLAKDLQAQGLAMDVVANRIGICAATLYLWQSSSRKSRMVPVKVARLEPQIVAPTRVRRAMVMGRASRSNCPSKIMHTN
jgi:transposase-like protein